MDREAGPAAPPATLHFLALAADPLPEYLDLDGVRALGAVTVVALLAALVSALAVVLPRRAALSSHRPDQQAELFQALLARRSRWLTFAVVAFGLGVTALSAVLVIALQRAQ